MNIPGWILSIFLRGKLAGLVPVITTAVAAKNNFTPGNREIAVKALGDFIVSEDPAIAPEIVDIETLDVAVENYIASTPENKTANAEIAGTAFAKLVKDVAAPKITDEHFANIANSIQAGLADEGIA